MKSSLVRVGLAIVLSVVVAAFAYGPIHHRSIVAKCSAPPTLDRLYALLADNFFKDDAADLVHYRDFMTIDLITFDSFNKENERITCDANIELTALYKDFAKRSVKVSYSRQPESGTNSYIYRIESLPFDDFKSWLIVVKPPTAILVNPIIKISNWYAVDRVPTKVGECTISYIQKKSTRLQTPVGETLIDVPGSGSAIEFKNGVQQVSYDRVEAVESSNINDQVKICAIDIETRCPAGDVPTITYLVFDLNTERAWSLPNDEHSCNGA